MFRAKELPGNRGILRTLNWKTQPSAGQPNGLQNVREYPVSLMREFSFDNTEDTEDTEDWGVPEGYYGED